MGTIGEINGATDWGRFLEGVSAIVHAAVAEVAEKPDDKQLHTLQSVNIDGTLNSRVKQLHPALKVGFLELNEVNGALPHWRALL